MKKKILVTLMAAAMTVCMSIPAFAGQWLSDATGWWWQNNDGSFPANTWMWIDGNNDGVSECYYFNENGYCLMNTTTPDGYEVNPTGAWIINGVIQQQAAVPDTTASSTSSVTYGEIDTSVNPPANAVNLLDMTPVTKSNYSVVTNVKTTRDELWANAFQIWTNGGYAEFYLGGQYSHLTFTFAPKQGMGETVETYIEIYGDDDEQLWASDEIDYKTKAETVTVDISGQDYIKFYVNFEKGFSYILFKNVQVW